MSEKTLIIKQKILKKKAKTPVANFIILCVCKKGLDKVKNRNTLL